MVTKTFLNLGSIITLSPLINAIKTTPVIYPIDNGGCFFVKWNNGSYISGLLFQIKQGFDPKKKRNLPNKLYLTDLEVTAKDVYIKKDFANKTAEPLDMSGTDKMTDRQTSLIVTGRLHSLPLICLQLLFF